jgi:hypothetical protein
MQCFCGVDIAPYSGKGRRKRFCSNTCKQEAYRNRETEKRHKSLREQRCKLYIVPCSLDIANAFVTILHRHNKAVPGAKFCCGVVDEDGLLHGVCIVGRPVARNLDDGFTLETNRVCSDGTPNACSALYGACRRIAFDLGYKKIVTYTLIDESGASMRGAGWKRVAEIQSSPNWHKSRTGRSEQSVYQMNKWRWESINPEYAHNKTRPSHIILPEEIRQSEHVQQLNLFAI